jgi:hypothetical protein
MSVDGKLLASVIDLIHTALLLETAFTYTITHYGQPETVGIATKSLNSAMVLTGTQAAVHQSREPNCSSRYYGVHRPSLLLAAGVAPSKKLHPVWHCVRAIAHEVHSEHRHGRGLVSCPEFRTVRAHVSLDRNVNAGCWRWRGCVHLRSNMRHTDE